MEGKLTSKVIEKLVYAGLADGVFVSPVTAWEVGLLARPKASAPSLQFLPDPQSWFAALLAKPVIKLAPLTPQAAILSSSLPQPFHNDPADRLLVATARQLNVAVLTRDGGILAYGKAGHVKTERC